MEGSEACLHAHGSQGVHCDQVQEAIASSEGFLQMPDASINMGNLFLALDKPNLAIQVLQLSISCSSFCSLLHMKPQS